mmetsp:Transcript_39604/g.71027  ORF Transcript_39604/g.71027 Transcript_39604/m.71027 type:complete len:95 (+) Transcript_39604:212-496(+)
MCRHHGHVNMWMGIGSQTPTWMHRLPLKTAAKVRKGIGLHQSTDAIMTAENRPGQEVILPQQVGTKQLRKRGNQGTGWPAALAPSTGSGLGLDP